MLGTQATYSTEIRAAKPRSWRTPIILVVLLVLIGAGGWWMVQNGQGTSSATDPGNAAAVAVAADGLQAIIDSAAPAAAGEVGTAADAQAEMAQSISQATAPAAQQVVSSGIAGVKGASVWGDDGNFAGTLDSGSLVTIKARTSDSAWLSVETEAGSGWIQAPAVIAYGLQRLATAVLPDAVALANMQATLTPAGATTTDATTTDTDVLAVALLDAGSSDAVAADAAPATTSSATASSADSSQPVNDGSGQLTATVAAADSRLNVRSGPGTDYLVIAKAGDGEEYNVIGRNNTGDWLLLQLRDDTSDVGWVSAGYVELSGNSQTLPVAD